MIIWYMAIFLMWLKMENGDLMAVGRIDDYLEYDPIAMTERADPDILIVRTDANGCI